MAIKTTLEVELKSNLLEHSKYAKSIKDNLEAAGRVRISNPVAAARVGVAAAATGRMPAAAYKVQRDESVDYGITRSMGAGTGAAGRDFAKQAQGLGGLVHVYATFAANLFAVTAAFTALSRAADTTNMTKGLDQLGISSGRNLGTLAKQLSSVTDGAISSRDAMTATAQASAGGMTNAAILRMGNVAKQASQALGVAMPDAMSRLSRGITKLEPELLDEIGIMVRVDTSAQAYALTLGKTASALSDFEKRQGFANAVLEQGEKKFGAINIDANPYAKILASMTNLSFAGLELLNKVLSPVLFILSSSPAALAIAMASVAAILLKQAIPALGSFKESMKEAAEASVRLANIKSLAAKRGSATQHAQNLADAADYADTQIDAVDRVSEKIKKAGAVRAKMSKSAFLDRPIGEMDDAYFKKIEATAKGLVRKGLSESAANYREFAKASKEALDSDAKHNLIKKEWLIQLEKEKSISTAIGRTQIIADRANLDAVSRSIKSQAAETASTQGFTAAWKEARVAIVAARTASSKTVEMPTGAFDALGKAVTKAETITTPAMGRIRQVTTSIGVGISAATSTIGSLMNFLGPWMFAIGLLVGAYQLLDTWLSKGAKEIGKFNTSLDSVTESTTLLKDVSKDLFSKDAKDWLSAESMQARSNAIGGTADAINSMLKDLGKAELSAGWWDNWWDNSFNRVFSKSRIQKTAAAIKNSIKETIALARPSEAKTLFQQRVLDITGSKDIDSLNSDKLTAESLKNLSTTYNLFSNSVAKSAEELSAPKKAFEALGAAMQTLGTAMLPTDNVSKFGIELMNVGSSLQALSGDTQGYFTELVRVSKDVGKLSLLPKGRGVELAKQSEALQDLQFQYGAVSKGIENVIALEAELAALSFETMSPEGKGIAANEAIAEASLAFGQQLDLLKTFQAGALKAQEKVAKEFGDLAGASLRAGAKYFTEALSITIEQGALKVLGAVANSITGLGSAEAKAAVALKEISLRAISNDIMMSLIIENQKNTLAIMENTAAVELALTEKKLGALKGSQLPADVSEVATLEAKRTTLLSTQANVKRANEWMAEPRANLLKRGSEDKTVEGAGAFALLKGTAQQIAAGKAAASVLAYEREAVKLGAAIGAIAEKYTSINRARQSGITLLEGEQKTLSQLAGMSNSMELQSLANSAAVNIEKEKSVLLTNAALQLEEEYTLKKSKLTLGSDVEVALTKNYKDQTAALKEKTDEQKVSNAAAKVSRDLADIALAVSKESYRLDGLRLKQETGFAADTSRLDNNKAELESLKAVGYISEANYLREKATLDLKGLELNNTKEIAGIEETRTRALKDAATANSIQLVLISAMKGTTTEIDAAKLLASSKLLEAQNRANDSANSGLAISKAKLLSDTNSTVQQSLHTQLLAKQTDEMSKMAQITESLAGAFGKVGEAIGKVGEAILQMSHNDQTYLKAKLALQDKIAKETGPVESIKNKTDLMKLEKQKTTSELTDYAKVAGAAKKMFSEKTAAYKVFAGIEKAANILKMASLAKELFLELGLTTAKATGSAVGVAGTMAEMGASLIALPSKIAGGVAKFFEQSGWLGFAGAAAFLALMASLGGGSSASVSAPPAGSNAADRQSTQGTGMSWVDGKKVENGGGVFGDAEAKSSVIVDSLEIMKSNSIIGLDYDNRLLKAMEKVALAVSNVATSVYQIPGVRVGSGFGTTEGSSGGTFLGWGKTTTTTIQDAGVVISGAFSDLADVSKNAVRQYETVFETSFKSSWFGLTKSSSSSIRSSDKEISDPKLKQAFASIFQNATEVFVEVGKSAGITKTAILNTLSTLPISLSTSLKGLTGPQMEAELNATVGNALSQASEVLFAGLFERFKNFGEDYLTTVIRVVDSNKKLDMSLKSIGSSFEILSNFDISEGMVLAAGSLETFMEQSAYFVDTFLSNQEKITPVLNGVSKELIRLGISSGTTKDQFKALVLSQDLSTEAGRGLYQNLMELAPGFAKVSKVAEELLGWQDKLNVLLGVTTDKEISLRNDLANATSEATKAVIRQVYAQEALKEATSKTTETLTKATNDAYATLERSVAAQRKTIEITKTDAGKQVSLIGSIFNTLKDQVQSLYAEVSGTAAMSAVSGNQFIDQALATAKLSGTMPEIDALNQAISSVRKGFSDTIYESSFEAEKAKLVLAGKLAEFRDISKVQLTSAESQLLVAENQLKVLTEALDTAKTQMDALRGIDTSILSVASAIIAFTKAIEAEKAKLDTAKTQTDASILSMTSAIIEFTKAIGAKSLTRFFTTQGFASGGSHTGGLRIVGEAGPELEVTGPSRIFNANQTRGILSGNSEATTKEIAMLREENKAQAQAIVQLNLRMVKLLERWDNNGMPTTRIEI